MNVLRSSLGVTRMDRRWSQRRWGGELRRDSGGVGGEETGERGHGAGGWDGGRWSTVVNI